MSSNPESEIDTHINHNFQPWWRASAADAGDTSSKQVKFTKLTHSGLDANYSSESQDLQHVASTAPPASAEYLIPQARPGLPGNSIACAPFPYADPFYGGLMTAYGQALVNPHLIGTHQTRMPVPLEMAEEPVYVNPKQYNGIMRRRQSRAKAELEKKLVKARKPYLHESRHQHALRRQRGCGGRFVNTKKLNKGTEVTPEEGMDSAASLNTRSASTLRSAVTTQCTEKLNATNGPEEFKEGPMRGDMTEQHTYSNEENDDNSCYQHHQDFRLSSIRPLSGERGEEGDCSGQLRGSILARQASHRALTIQ